MYLLCEYYGDFPHFLYFYFDVRILYNYIRQIALTVVVCVTNDVDVDDII